MLSCVSFAIFVQSEEVDLIYAYIQWLFNSWDDLTDDGMMTLFGVYLRGNTP